MCKSTQIWRHITIWGYSLAHLFGKCSYVVVIMFCYKTRMFTSIMYYRPSTDNQRKGKVRINSDYQGWRQSDNPDFSTLFYNFYDDCNHLGPWWLKNMVLKKWKLGKMDRNKRKKIWEENKRSRVFFKHAPVHATVQFSWWSNKKRNLCSRNLYQMYIGVTSLNEKPKAVMKLLD